MNANELEAKAAALLPCVLPFAQHFTRGALEGLTYGTSLRFESEASARAYVAAINRNHAKGELDYYVTTD